MDRLRWPLILFPLLVIGVVEILSDTWLDPALPFPMDTVVVLAAVFAFGVLYWRLAADRISRLDVALAARNRELEERNAAARALHRVSVAMTALADVDEVTQAVVDQARILLHGDVAVLLLVGADGELALRAGSGPQGAIDRTGSRPGVDDRRFIDPAYTTARLAAPLQRGGETIGLLVVTCLGTRSFDVDDVETLSSLANQAAIALENDRLQGRLRELAVVAERERIAREMHDGLAQVLGYVNTKSQAVETLLEAGRVADARNQLGELAAAARSVYVDVREAILGLRSPIRPGFGLAGALEEYANRFADASKLAVIVEVAPEARVAALTGAEEAQAFRIAQEALTNVRKHAGAGRVSISLRLEGETLVLAIADDGRGLPPVAVPGRDWPHYGLDAIRERALEIGGDVSWSIADPAAGRGTLLRLAVPLAGRTAGRSVAGAAR